MKTVKKMTAFLLVLCVALLVPACGLERCTPAKISRESVIWQNTEEPLRERTAAPVLTEAETGKTAGSAVRKNRLPAIGYVAGLLSLNAVAFWCAAKNHERKKCA